MPRQLFKLSKSLPPNLSHLPRYKTAQGCVVEAQCKEDVKALRRSGSIIEGDVLSGNIVDTRSVGEEQQTLLA